ncbi:MAG: ferrous iron transport protein A [Carboxydocellales bacterium]
MSLDKVQRGQSVKVCLIPGDVIRAQAIRFGIAEGAVVVCAEIIPAGPIIVRKSKQEIAIGRGLAKKILVELIN